MKTTTRERDRAARAARLEHMREQVAMGTLVIRQMTRAERARSDEQLAALESHLTPAERTKRNAVLRERRHRAAYLA